MVEEARDVLTIESIHEHRGLYHVLMGAISPIDGVGPDNLRIASLVERVSHGGIREVILATNPTVEGETTALYLVKALKDTGSTGLADRIRPSGRRRPGVRGQADPRPLLQGKKRVLVHGDGRARP